MTVSLNKVFIIGFLGRDIELKYTQNGQPIANLSIATTENYTNQEGVINQKTEWHRATVFGKIAENCAKHLSKGSLVYIEGSVATRKWLGKDGLNKFQTEIKVQVIKFLDRKDKGNSQNDNDNDISGYTDDTPF